MKRCISITITVLCFAQIFVACGDSEAQEGESIQTIDGTATEGSTDTGGTGDTDGGVGDDAGVGTDDTDGGGTGAVIFNECLEDNCMEGN
jgi:hypothetical protein